MRPALIVLFLVLADCILIVHPETYGDHCRFAGSETVCGACIAKACTDAVDACCGDPPCGSTLNVIEHCTTLRDSTCQTAKAPASDAPPSATTLAQCMAERCAGECAPLAPGHTSATTCNAITGSSRTACACAVSPSPSGNGFVCDDTTFPETVCCAPIGWPAAGLECTCLPVRCTPNADGCECSRVDYNVLSHPAECGGGNHCCAIDDLCQCGTRACRNVEHEVSSCGRPDVGCPPGQTAVSTCLL